MECADTLLQRSKPFISLIGRIESQGYTVDTTTLTTVTDEWDWSSDHHDTSAVHRHLAAERTSRTIQAAHYQCRLERMQAMSERIEAEYAQQLIDLAVAVRQ
ncbi:hypothetical protein ACNQP7_04675 [Mycolicibacterium fortuitum]|uniref:hypothetical protein n=1 Tax=Mycolicibacterium fortuitum TaxID=1766 RepID=UPI003AAD5220